MIKLSKNDEILISKYQKKVFKQFPKAFLHSINGKFTIVQETDEFQLKDILSELCILPQVTPVKAWEMAQMSAKTTQNLNRTHPLRIEAMDEADKILRAEIRKQKNGESEKNTKRDKLHNYYIYYD